ncbi:MAG: 3'(2'),5'-bisphosphate nucleotidase CysQ [Pseudolabrys sp.]
MPDSERPDRELAALRDPLAQTMREAGALALKGFRSATLKSWLKDKTSPVSETDLAVDALLRERLGALAPRAAWLSEESEDDPARLAAQQVWIVDPIDGTRGYIAGKPDWTISVALARGGRPVLAALYAPATDEMFLAGAATGATLNGRRLAVSASGALSGARFAGPKRYLDWISRSHPDAVTVPKIHSLALRLARVADGSLDAAFTSGHSHDWDLAAADLLVHEAGGALTDFSGRRLIYNNAEPVHEPLIAAGLHCHGELIELARDTGQPR